MSEPSIVSRGWLQDAARSALPAFVVLAAQTAMALVIYRHTLQLSFLSDAWVYLSRLRDGLWSMLAEPIGYHYQPVAYAWLAAIRAIAGENAAAFQAVNIAQLVVFGYLTYELGKRLMPNAGLAFLGSLLVVGSAAFYEAAYWPLSGNAHLLAAQLYVLAVILAHDVGAGRLGRAGPWLVGLAAFGAAFTHPAMITALPVCALVVILAADGRMTAQSLRDLWPRMLPVLIALGVIAVLFAMTRLQFASAIAQGPQASADPMKAYWLVTRGVIAVFSLRGSHEVVHRLMTLGTMAGFENGAVWLYVWGWLALSMVAAVACFVLPTSRGVRILVSVLAVHLVIFAIAAPTASRQAQLPAVPAALLTVWAIAAFADRLSRAMTGSAAAAVCRQLPAVAVLLLVVGARPDHQTAAEVHQRASTATRVLFDRVKHVDSRVVNLTLVNMPSYLVVRGIGAPAFSNGIEPLVRFTSVGFARFEWCWIAKNRTAPEFATHSIPVTADDLRARLREPNSLVLFYEEPLGVQPLTLDHVDVLFSH